MIKENIAAIKKELDSRPRLREEGPSRGNDITLIAVSKTKPISDVLEAYDAGIRDFGENYLQEAIPKIEQLCHSRERVPPREGEDGNPVWHYLGRMQSKKLKDIAKYFTVIHSLDRLDHAKKLNEIAKELDKALEVFIQVNLDSEAQKGGVLVDDLAGFIDALQSLEYLKIMGLMLIPKPASKSETLEKFKSLKRISASLGSKTKGYLSMGMSEDYELAIIAGATHIRIGTAIFGKRGF